MRTCEITVLGGFAVRVDGTPVPEAAWRHRRAAELVKLLALADGHRLHREHVMDVLWPDLGPEAAAANLRKAVHYARKALSARASISADGSSLQLFPGGRVSVDADEFEAAAHDDGPAALHRYAGDLLPSDRYASWAVDRRERLRDLYVGLLKQAGQWEDVIRLDPADELANRALMQRALDSGDRGAAIRQFEHLRERLRADLGVGPDRDTVVLYEKALGTAPGRGPLPSELIRSLIARALVQLSSGELDDADRYARKARALALDAGLGREMGESSAVLGIAANLRGRWREVFRTEFVDSVQRDPSIAGYVFDAHLCLAEYCLAGPNGPAEIRSYATELHAVAARSGSVQGRALADLLLGEAALAAGRLSESRRLLESAVELHERAGAPAGVVLGTLRLAELDMLRHERQAARQRLRGLHSIASASWLAPHLQVRLCAALVETSARRQAVTQVELADGALGGTSICPPCSMGFHVAAARALAWAGRLDQARGRLDEVERLVGMWPGGMWHAALWETRAVIREAGGKRDQASALFREAAERYSELGRVRDCARCSAAADVLSRADTTAATRGEARP